MIADDVARWVARPAGRPAPTDVEIARAVAEGLPAAAVDGLVARGALTSDELHRLVVPRRTLAHRKQHRQRLTADESERLARAARLVALAEGTLGDAARAHAWLRRPNRALGGQEPLGLLASEHGARAVEAVLGRVAHGVFS